MLGEKFIFFQKNYFFGAFILAPEVNPEVHQKPALRQGARAVCLLRSRRRTVLLFIEISEFRHKSSNT